MSTPLPAKGDSPGSEGLDDELTTQNTKESLWAQKEQQLEELAMLRQAVEGKDIDLEEPEEEFIDDIVHDATNTSSLKFEDHFSLRGKHSRRADRTA